MEKLRQANKTYYFETMKERYDVKENEYQASLRKELTKAAQRIAELDTIIQKLYEKQLLGDISDERFSKLSEGFEAEQAILKTQVMEKQTQLSEVVKSADNIERFLQTIRNYTTIEQLTPQIVNELVDKIVLHQPIGRGKKRQAKIELHYRFIGEL